MSRMTPGDVPRGRKPTVVKAPEPTDAEMDGDDELGTVMTRADAAELAKFLQESQADLAKLREPFPDELIEHLPKQKWKQSWKDQPYQNCDECGGYHPVGRPTIHLDYVGHAGVTRRLLEVDPMWDWEPLSWTEDGLPRFDKLGGLWIKLTVCGMTRLGYGDAAGKEPSTTAVKEIIGDAIRNAAMRFGVALDLWSKVDRHAGKNPEAIDEAPKRQSSGGGNRSQGRGSDQGRRNRDMDDASNPPRAANQDALDELLGVCDKHGLDTRWVEDRYNRTLGPPELVKASPDDIRNYAAILIDEATREPEGVDAERSGDDADEAQAGPPADDQPADDAGAGVGEVAPDDPDADVKAKPGDLF